MAAWITAWSLRGDGGRRHPPRVAVLTSWVLLLGAVLWPTRAGSFLPVGNTVATHLGDTGVLQFTLACQADFGPSARMCTSVEVLETVAVPSGFVATAWVRPVVGSGPMDLVSQDVSGQPFRSCNSWTSQLGTGLTMTATGGFRNEACDEPRPVACCTPLPEPSQLLSLSSGLAFVALLARRRRSQRAA